MSKKSLLSVIISIILVTVLVTMFSCAIPEEDEPIEPIKYYEDTPYDMTYMEDGCTYRLNLNGDGVGKMYKSADSVQEFNNLSCSVYVDKSVNFNTGSEEFKLYFLSDGTAVDVAKVERVPDNALSEAEIELNKTYTYTYKGMLEGYEVDCVCSIQLVQNPNLVHIKDINLTKEMHMNEHEYATGVYNIKNYDKVKLTMDADLPHKNCFRGYEIPVPISTSQNVTTSKEGDTGAVRIFISSTNSRYVQLYDDGHFEFLVASTSIPEETTYTKGSYLGQTFTNKYIRYYNGDRYTYTLEISFTNNAAAYVSYKILDCKMERHYQISQNEEGENQLTQIYYDVDIFNAFKGSHPEYYTGNSFSFANDGNIYVCYNEKYYDFTLDNLVIEEYEEYNYAILSKDGNKICIFLYEDGTWGWDKSSIIAR